MGLVCVASIKPPYGTPGYSMDKPAPTVPAEVAQPAWQGRSIAGPKLRLVEFSAFLEQQRDPESVSFVIVAFSIYVYI